MPRTILLVFMAVLASPAPAEASHCQKLSEAFQTIKSLRAQADRAEDQGDMDKACATRRKVTKLAEYTLRGVNTECFHGGKQAFANLVEASKAVEEMICG